MKLKNRVCTVYSYCITGVFDNPARSDILNVINATGFDCCIKCYQRGESLERIVSIT